VAEAASEPPTVWVGANFTSESLNERTLVTTALSAEDLSRKDLVEWISLHSLELPRKKGAILLGSFRKYPQAWFYVRVVNTSHKSKQLVVDEFNRIRCDDFEVISVKDGSTKNWGRISRTTPFSSYPLPFFTYAVPFTIQPKDTLHLLVHTQRHYGAHEVNLNISTYQTYLSEHIVHFLSKVFQVIIFVICVFIMFILGWIFNYKTMTYLGIYILSLLYLHLTSWGFTDAITHFTTIGLSGNNIGTFGIFVSCFLAYPFLTEWMKVVPKNEKIFNGISYSMMGFNLLAILCYFLPVRFFDTVYAYVDFPFLSLISVLITVLWMFYCSFFALFRVKIYYMLIGFGVAFLPLLLQQLSSIFVTSSRFLIQVSHPTFILAAIGLSIISIFLLRGQLVSRRRYEASVKQVKESLEEIRKSEVETIGRNLHDNVGNILMSATGYLYLRQPKIELSKELINKAINEIRFLSHNLVKDDDAPLHTKLDLLVNRFNDFSEVAFDLKDYSEGRLNELDAITQQNIYMIVQEVFTNIIKHAKATEVFVQVFEREGQTLQVIVEDDGIGILSFTENKGIGLKNIQKRATISNLKLTMDSTPAGSNFIIETPKMP
jgi:signal transduction histidine kinase